MKNLLKTFSVLNVAEFVYKFENTNITNTIESTSKTLDYNNIKDIKSKFKHKKISEYDPYIDKEFIKKIEGNKNPPATPQNINQMRLYNSKKMSRHEYLGKLANYLKTPENISIFLDLKMKYTSDIKRKDNWQLAHETITRQENGKMLGDCDDYAFLAKELLSRIRPKRINAHVMLIPGHAICVWIEKNKYGKYDACSIGTYGFDKNGNKRKYRNRNGVVQKRKFKNTINKGFSTIQDALNSILKKYDKPGKGVTKPRRYRVNNRKILLGENTMNQFGTDDKINGRNGRVFYKNMPIGLLLSDHKLLEYKKASNTAKRSKQGKDYIGKQILTHVWGGRKPTKEDLKKWRESLMVKN